ncbi:MAG TPA: tetrahydromethanopterin S-methyltransferase subunit D [Methanocella sp.]|nr:tetrahydromethanopterin S-methyltransferase subunit D [Methanocella sp.]
MEPLTLLIIVACIGLGGLLVGLGVHFVPVGGAPAAMAQATGIGTGTTMLAASSGFLGLISAGLVTAEITNGKISYPGFTNAVDSQTLLSISGITSNIGAIAIIIAAGVIGAMLMISILCVVPNVLYIFGLGVPLASAKVKFDPLTGDRQDIYVTRGTEGHGTPSVAVISSLIGGLLAGIGGALTYLALLAGGFSIATAAFAAIGIFFVNSVLASYNIAGTIEGFHDPKFKRWPRAFVGCLIASVVLGIWAAAIMFLGA